MPRWFSYREQHLPLRFAHKPAILLWSKNNYVFREHFETCVTQKYSDPPSLPQKLLGAISTILKQIEFPLKFDNHRSEINEASIKTAKRFKAEFKLLYPISTPPTSTSSVRTHNHAKDCSSARYTPASFSPERRLAPFIAPIAKRHRSQRFSKSIFTIALKCCYSMALSVFHSWNGGSGDCHSAYTHRQQYNGGQAWLDIKRDKRHTPRYTILECSRFVRLRTGLNQEGEGRKGREFKISWDQLWRYNR